jgi:hypothetical protein
MFLKDDRITSNETKPWCRDPFNLTRLQRVSREVLKWIKGYINIYVTVIFFLWMRKATRHSFLHSFFALINPSIHLTNTSHMCTLCRYYCYMLGIRSWVALTLPPCSVLRTTAVLEDPLQIPQLVSSYPNNCNYVLTSALTSTCTVMSICLIQ